jgi:adenylate kinase
VKILILGLPGSGKSTIGKLLADKLNVQFVPVGKTLRNLPKDHPNYQTIHEHMETGKLAPYGMVGDILKERISELDCADGYVLDGWARDIENLKYFDPDFDKVIFLSIPGDLAIKRITGRRICDTDGSVCNIFTLPTQDGNCSLCHGNLIQRKDDKENVVRTRLHVFKTETIPVVEHFREKGKLLQADASQLPGDVVDSILEKL